MPTDKEIVAFKIGARARKMANEDCVVEGYEILLGAIQETTDAGDSEMESLLRRELQKYEAKYLEV